VIISIDIKKALDRVQCPLLIRTFKSLNRKGNFLNTIKAIYEKPTADIRINRQKLKVYLLRSGTRQGCLTSPH
jgi:hypothetical protein